ncbi:MAG: hypothetical protein ACT4TC_13440 [Myxococcaceae bacterium]
MATQAPPRQKVKLEELLLRHGAITQEQLDKAHVEQKKWGGDLGMVLVEMGFLQEALLMKAYAHLLSIPLADPVNDPIAPELIKAVGVQICEQYGVIPIGGDLAKKKLIVATSEPTKSTELTAVARLTGLMVEPAAATADSIARGIRKHYWGEDEGAQAATDGKPASFMQPAVRPPPAEVMDAPRQTTDMPTNALAALLARLSTLEQQVKPLANQGAALLTSNADFAGLLSRVEKLEQLIASEGHLVRVLSELMAEKGLVTREELFERLIQKKR